MKIFTISASEENGGTVQIVAACQTNDIVNFNETMIGSNTSVDVYLKEPLDREVEFLMNNKGNLILNTP